MATTAKIVTIGDAYRLIKERVDERRAAGIPKPTTWDDWWAELKVLAADPINWTFVHDGNEECWRDYFNDDNTPAEALREDISYCD